MDFININSPLGRIGIAGDEAVREISFSPFTEGGRMVMNENPLLLETARQLGEYFRGERKGFTVPLAPEGTEFMHRVWNGIIQIPYGHTCSYVDVATQLGSPSYARAVGNANHCNPIPIIIPCHRVIAKNGAVAGYGGGIETKLFLLRLEGVKL